MIKFENVNVTIQEKRILSDVNLEIQDGEFVLICGESGCGKTTMTKLINGLIPHFCEGCQRRRNDYGLREKCCRDAYV